MPLQHRSDDPCGFFDPFKEVDGYAEAVARENEGFDVAWLGLPDLVAGVPILPLSCRHLLWLELVKSPFLLKVQPEQLVAKPDIIEDTGRYLWITSTEFEPLNLARKTAYLDKSMAALGKEALLHPKTGWLPHFKSILDQVSSAFADAPTGHSGDCHRYYSYAASIADFYGTNYHLTPQEALKQPLAITWQLMRCRRKALDPKYSPALSSEELLSDYLKKVNAQQN